jgi:hypothetical protein
MEPKSVETRLKEATESSIKALALNEQVLKQASEKESAYEQKLAELLAEREASAKALNELIAGREASAKALKEMEEKVSAVMAMAKTYEAEAKKAGKGKADLNEYTDRVETQRDEDGEKTPAEENNESGSAEDCEPMKKGKKASKKASMEDDSDYGDLSDEEIQMIRQVRQDEEACGPNMKKGKKADSDLSNPTKEDSKDFNKSFPQKKMAKVAKKAEKETDVEEINESPDMQNKENEEGGEENEEHITTLSKPDKNGKKAKKAEKDMECEDEGETENGLPKPVMDYIRELIKQEKSGKAKGENNLGGINKQEVTREKDEVEEDGEGSFLNKKDGKAKGKKAEQAPAIEAKAEQAYDVLAETAPAPESPAPALEAVATQEAPKAVAEEVKPDTSIDEAVSKLAAIASAKVKAESENRQIKELLAFETKAKTEAMAAVELLQKKFEALVSKVNSIEESDKTVEMKAAKIISAQASEAVAVGVEPTSVEKTDADYLKEFEAITDKREQNKFFNAHRTKIERAAFVNLRKRS